MATNQPNQPRPWLRLTSLARPTIPAPAPAAAPAPAPPPVPRPTLRPLPQAPPSAAPAPPAAASPAPAAPPAPAAAPPAPFRPTLRPLTQVPAPAAPTERPAPAPTAQPPAPVIVAPFVPEPRASVLARPFASPPSQTYQVPTTTSVPTSPAKPVTVTPPRAAPTAAPPASPPKPAAVPLTSGAPAAVPPASPATKSVKTTSSPTGRLPYRPIAATGNGSPTASSRTLKPAAETPPQSPPRKPTAPPPSPLTLPPAQLKSQGKLEPVIPIEAEQKTVLVQKTVGKPSSPHIDGKHEPAKKHADKEQKAHHKKLPSDSEETGVRIITIAGENKGAFMELIKQPNRKGFEGHPHYLQKKGQGTPLSDGSSEFQSYSSSDEGKQQKRDLRQKSKAPVPTNAYMNSNVQGVNNSIVYNSSYTHHDPGVHAVFSRKPAGGGGGFYVKEHTNVE